jgi:hypothetical protein
MTDSYIKISITGLGRLLCIANDSFRAMNLLTSMTASGYFLPPRKRPLSGSSMILA